MKGKQMPKSKLDDFFDQYLEALDEGNAALFVGAGLSQPSGYVNWKGLMRGIAKGLGLDVDKETDLIAVAQYHVNTQKRRTRLNKALIEEFTKAAILTENHKLIARMPIKTVWTTNLDTLLEQAFQEAQKRVDVKKSKEDFAYTLSRRDVTIYKMHGDASQPNEAVLTKDDYETYAAKRAIFSTKLKGDLVDNTFLFLGFSFTDPNVDYILSRIHSLMGQENQREHYCIMKWPERPKGNGKKRAEYEYARRKKELRVGDLFRYGIQPIMIDDYSEVTDILRQLNRRSHRKYVFVSGSAHQFDPMGRERIEVLGRAIGKTIIERGLNLVSGFGLGIGDAVILGALETAYADERINPDNRIFLYPFPQQPPQEMTRKNFYTKYREGILSRIGFTIFLCGNKLDPASGKTIIADGVLEEFNITKKLDKRPIPVGATGYAAHQIWGEVNQSIERFYPEGGVKNYFRTLANRDKTNEEIIEAIFAIIDRVVSR
jgi:hypothetical protein